MPIASYGEDIVWLTIGSDDKQDAVFPSDQHVSIGQFRMPLMDPRVHKYIVHSLSYFRLRNNEQANVGIVGQYCVVVY